MPQIKILPVELRNKIAAGEVIERPASVVKELVENAIDAGSTEIRIEVLRGGKGLIKVDDNGAGMDKDDAFLCVEPHATSKLMNEQDLFHITTLGFRGEALPSIASVSRVNLITGLKDAHSGVSLEICGGQVEMTRECPARGTTIEIRDLFFNTPGRKKFLKSDSTELFHIIDSVTKEALSHWEIGFSLITEKQQIMSLPRASGPKERILQTYGLEFMEGLMEVAAEGQGVKMNAFLTKGTSFRNTKAHQFIFVNRRPVKDQSISHAAYAAYEGMLPHEQHPVFFLFFDIDPQKVDFNVHPTKREVRFENKQDIHGLVKTSLREALRRERISYAAPFSDPPEWVVSENPVPFGAQLSKAPSPPGSEGYGTADLTEEKSTGNVQLGYQPAIPFLYLGDTFMAAAGKGGLTLIDHHAAHERILYENLLKGINLDSHQLLFPRQVRLSHKEYALIMGNRSILQDMGLELDDFGHDTLLVRSLPEVLRDGDIRGILSDVAAALLEGIPPLRSIKELLAARIACHSSLRGKEILEREEFQKLLSGLEMTEQPDQCPHGRPTRIFISMDELKKMFKRR